MERLKKLLRRNREGDSGQGGGERFDIMQHDKVRASRGPGTKGVGGNLLDSQIRPPFPGNTGL